jgi:hypothetical protein
MRVLQQICDSLLKVNFLQGICDSLSKLSCVHWISIRCWNCVACSELAFTVEMSDLQQNCDSLPKLSCLQRISIHCWKWVCCSEFRIHYWSDVVCSEFVIRYRSSIVCSEIMIRCQNWGACSETVFVAELCSLQRNSFRCRIVQPAAKQFLLLNYAAYSEPVFATKLFGRNESVFAAESCGRLRISFVADFDNRPPGHKWLKCLWQFHCMMV